MLSPIVNMQNQWSTQGFRFLKHFSGFTLGGNVPIKEVPAGRVIPIVLVAVFIVWFCRSLAQFAMVGWY